MLPDPRRAAKPGLIPFHPIGRRRHLDRLPVDHHRARAQLRVADQIPHRIDGAVGRLRVGQPVHCLCMAQATEDALDHGLELVPVAGARGVVAKARVFAQQLVAQHDAAEAGPLALVLNRDHKFAAIGAGEGAIGRDEPQHAEQVVLGPDGLADSLPKGGIAIEMSTIAPGTWRRVGDTLRARGMDLVDSPVGKTSEHAVTGTLTLMVYGNPAAIKRAMPVLNCMGTDTYLCGGPGTGHAIKMTNKLLAITIMSANTEALAIGIKAGLTLELMQEVMRTTNRAPQATVAAHGGALRRALPGARRTDRKPGGRLVTQSRRGHRIRQPGAGACLVRFTRVRAGQAAAAAGNNLAVDRGGG